ncbi:unnamed protein product [Tetraodon nigroviridis]|uniref:(spotted green pufferfish) hypothetical protein n=1 Tax=Tetraodon nigroviridis TaxID=99883 RepID=Q4SYT3_TETNG|nr:unnamed protein product [Tetraodon nigroviridis]
MDSMSGLGIPQCCGNVSVLQQKWCTSSNLSPRRTCPRQTCPGGVTHMGGHTGECPGSRTFHIHI